MNHYDYEDREMEHHFAVQKEFVTFLLELSAHKPNEKDWHGYETSELVLDWLCTEGCEGRQDAVDNHHVPIMAYAVYYNWINVITHLCTYNIAYIPPNDARDFFQSRAVTMITNAIFQNLSVM